MATKWISKCDFCGVEETSGDDAAQAIFNMPGQPDSAYFRFSHAPNDAAKEELTLELCGPCGGELMVQLQAIVAPRFWNIEADD